MLMVVFSRLADQLLRMPPSRPAKYDSVRESESYRVRRLRPNVPSDFSRLGLRSAACTGRRAGGRVSPRPRALARYIAPSRRRR